VKHGKLVSLKFISEEDLEKSPLKNEIEKGITIYNGGRKRQNPNKRRN
jgi:hypothetical protein